MVLDFDSTEPVHRPGDLALLVEAVVAADDEDETDWLEWKSSGDLTTKETQFGLAKEILGFANRDPADAVRFVGGYGYLVVGACGGVGDGITPIDVAQLDGGMRRYLGDDGPQWSPQYLQHGDQVVLLIKIEPPRDGDPVFTLRHELSPYREGTIYVRKGTRAEPASSSDVERLVRRACALTDRPAIGPDVDVVVVGEVLSVPESAVRSKIDEMVSDIADGIVDESRNRVQEQTSSPGLDSVLDAMRTQGAPQFDDRWDEWVTTVVAWQQPAAQTAWGHLLEWLTEADMGRVDLRVENVSDHNIVSVRVSLHLQAETFLAFDEDGLTFRTSRPAYRPPLRGAGIGVCGDAEQVEDLVL